MQKGIWTADLTLKSPFDMAVGTFRCRLTWLTDESLRNS